MLGMCFCCYSYVDLIHIIILTLLYVYMWMYMHACAMYFFPTKLTRYALLIYLLTRKRVFENTSFQTGMELKKVQITEKWEISTTLPHYRPMSASSLASNAIYALACIPIYHFATYTKKRTRDASWRPEGAPASFCSGIGLLRFLISTLLLYFFSFIPAWNEVFFGNFSP